MKKIEIDEDLMKKVEKMYYIDKKSTNEISDLLGYHITIIRKILIKDLYGIRTKKAAAELRGKQKKGYKITKQSINRLREGFFKKLKDEDFRKVLSEKKQGEKNTKAKLTETEVRSIREEFEKYLTLGYGKRESHIILGQKYNVNKSTISSIVRYKTWKHIT